MSHVDPAKVEKILEAMVNSNVSAEEALSNLEEDGDDGDEKEGGKTPSEDAVIEFLVDNPDPEDDDVHEWTEKHGFNTPKSEAVFYGLASRFVDFLLGGKSNEPGAPEKFDPKQIAMGIKVESEHIDDEMSQEKIASDHLAEFPGVPYYSYLDLLEKLMRKSEKAPSTLDKFRRFVESV
jgi:hypothetical protein